VDPSGKAIWNREPESRNLRFERRPDMPPRKVIIFGKDT
jgi:hypothetical protein